MRTDQRIDAQSFIAELIRSGHFPNDKIEEGKIEQVQKSLDKYIFIVENSSSGQKEKTHMHLQDWLASIAACEIEEILDPPRKERILIDYMFESMKEKIKLRHNIPEEEKNIQIYIATQRALFKLDNSIIAYHLLKRKYPNWRILQSSGLNKNDLEETTKNIYSIWTEIEKSLKHPLSERFYRICERYDTPYLILGDIFSYDPAAAQEILKNPELLELEIKKIYQTRLGLQKSKVSRAAIYSTLSIFVTKVLIGLMFELPIDKHFHQFRIETIGLSIAVPSFLMLFLILSIRPPSKQNMQKVIMETMKIAYVNAQNDTYLIKSAIVKSGAVIPFYFVTFVAAFLAIWRALELLKFYWPSKIIFIIFLSLISFAGTKIRERAKELSVEEGRASFLGSIIDWFSLPFIQLGKWMSGQWARYNVILVLLLTLIDYPFQIFIEFVEQWRTFIKERKEEIH